MATLYERGKKPLAQQSKGFEKKEKPRKEGSKHFKAKPHSFKSRERE